MNANWPTSKLRDIADVRVSNVDKKTSHAETPVKLCNYMDVYANDYVTKSIDFMAASASKSEIERFCLQAGDVIITKDSETPDDIGVPAVVTDSIDGLVCGYHLALIRPRSDVIDSIYLAKQLSTGPIARYFALNASGSTRFGLPISVIEDTRIPVAPKPEQTEIATILSTVDRSIEQTEALIAKQQRIKTGLMQDLLTLGIDEHGNLRSEKTHEFKDSPLGRIPVKWEVRRLATVATVKYGISDAIDLENRTGIPTISLPCVTPNGDLDLSLKKLVFTRLECVRERDLLIPGDLLFNWRNGSQEHLGKTAYFDGCGSFTHVGFLLRVRANNEIVAPRYLWYLINDIKSKGFFLNAKIQVNNTFNSNELYALEFAFPPLEEQQLIRDCFERLESSKVLITCQLRKLHSLKTALMQDLLNGKRRVITLRPAASLPRPTISLDSDLRHCMKS